MSCSLPCTGPRTVQVCPCPSPKGWYQADQEAGAACSYFSLSEFCQCRDSLSFRGCCAAGGTLCMECVSESVCLSRFIHVSSHGSANFCACLLRSEFCCRSSVSCQGSCFCSVPCSSLRTERACTCPSPKEWYRTGSGRSLGFSRRIFVGTCWYYSICVVAGVVRCNRVGGLCLLWMWMICDVSMFPSFRPVASVSSCRLFARLRVRILNFACPCARGDFCDVFGAEAGISPGRCCVASVCSILCWYQDIISRA